MINLTKENYNVTVKLVLENNLEDKFIKLEELKVFTGKCGEVYDDLNLENEGFIYLGLGKTLELDSLRMAGFNLGKLLLARKISNINIDLEILKEANLKAFFEGFVDSTYKFEFYKNKKTGVITKNVNALFADTKVVQDTINLMTGVFKARDLVNLTPIDLYPETYALDVIETFKNTSVEVQVFNKEEIEALNMHALLAVSKGSEKEPRFIVLKYFNNKDTDKHLTVVGKGVTYDSGGYALKPAGSMADMKSDMAGSAAVVGLFKALSLNNIKTNVVGVMALTENMIDGKAYKNGDVIKTMKGLTVEVVNTDAEGRLTLADAIYYSATKLNSTKIIELSTLTGAAVAALGSNITAITTYDDELYSAIHEAGLNVGEFNWRMPITKDFENAVKSDIAELKNAVAGGGGMMTAGIFLNNFNEDVPFIHLDIAGPSSLKSAFKHLPKGGTGVGVKTLYEYILKNN